MKAAPGSARAYQFAMQHLGKIFGRDAKPLWLAENYVSQDSRNVSVSLTDSPKMVREWFGKTPEWLSLERAPQGHLGVKGFQNISREARSDSGAFILEVLGPTRSLSPIPERDFTAKSP